MIDLLPEELSEVRQVLHSRLPGREVLAFGSRVTGTAKPYSDLDLVVMGSEPVDSAQLSALREAFQESDLLFRVDLLDWHRISPEFRAVIEQDFVVIQQK